MGFASGTLVYLTEDDHAYLGDIGFARGTLTGLTRRGWMLSSLRATSRRSRGAGPDTSTTRRSGSTSASANGHCRTPTSSLSSFPWSFRPLRTRSGLKQIGVSTGIGKRKNEFACGRVEVEQYPIVFDVAVAQSFKVVGMRMF